MRLLFGIILGACLTVGGAYLYDSHNALDAVNAPASAQRPLVNWDIVSVKWEHLTVRARTEWTRLTGYRPRYPAQIAVLFWLTD